MTLSIAEQLLSTEGSVENMHTGDREKIVHARLALFKSKKTGLIGVLFLNAGHRLPSFNSTSTNGTLHVLWGRDANNVALRAAGEPRVKGKILVAILRSPTESFFDMLPKVYPRDIIVQPNGDKGA